jgi:5'-3' exoribonuclease 1
MGIPFYFRTLVNNHSGLIKNSQKVCDTLYLDFNCIVHTVAQACSSQASNDISLHDLEANIIEESVKYIKHIIGHCQPQKLLYVAVDGVCPRAKMSQQRKRRYMSVWRNGELAKVRNQVGLPKESLWDSNVVTPGTDFMKRLDDRLQQLEGETSSFKVICSPSSEPGEGEHKAVQHLRQQLSQGLDTGNVVIYGLDADLILLALVMTEAGCNISLLREKPEFNGIKQAAGCGPFCTLDIALLREKLTMDLASTGLEPNIPDYILLCSLVGNDFLPSLSHLKIKTNGLGQIMAAYKKAQQPGLRLLCTTTFEINWDLLRLILEYLSDNEDLDMGNAVTTYYSSTPMVSHGLGPVELRSNQLDTLPQHKHGKVPSQGSIDPTKHGWRQSYYYHLFGGRHDLSTIEQACKQYTTGLGWIARYYFDKCPDQSWYYPYCYSPTMVDLHNYIKFNLCTSLALQQPVLKQKDVPYSPELQLLLVLPTETLEKVSPKLANIAKEAACAYMYPSAFRISSFLKHYLWECTPLLPSMDEDLLRKKLGSKKNEQRKRKQ